MYGVTEATITSTAQEVATIPAGQTRLPIGRPLPGVSAYVLDASLQLVPVGTPGELYVGGAGVAREYLHRPVPTADRFVPDPFAAGSRLYRTGDRARWLPDGALEFLGRADDQIKVRGYRIEPAEIEAALLSHPHVAEAVVTSREFAVGDARLTAYVVPGDLAADDLGPTLRGHLAVLLPAYLVPAQFVTVSAIPRTAGGKVDRIALPAPRGPGAPVPWPDGDRRDAPHTGTQAVLTGIWRELLGTAEISVQDNFFELGGHSLLLIRVQARIATALGLDLPIVALYENPTIAALARFLDSGDQAVPGSRTGETTPLDGRSLLRRQRQRREATL
jgi:hypothetical protein